MPLKALAAADPLLALTVFICVIEAELLPTVSPKLV